MPDSAIADAIFKSVEDYLARSLKAFEAKISANVASSISALPVPKDGEPGKDASPVDVDALVKQIGDAVMPHVEESMIVRLNLLAPTFKAKDGEPGKDAIVPSLLINDAGELVAVYADGETKTVGMVRGKDGNRGASVMDGAIDGDGQLTLRMSDGRLINVGVVRGKDGKDAVGKAGLPGRDATEVRVLPAIDEAKSYPEGTYAAYRGGEIRAERTTDPITDGDVLKAGWRIAREGIAEESEQEIDDGRVIERTTVYTSGRAWTRRKQTVAMVYRGVYRRATKYDIGDVVTSGGSSWHCQAQTEVEPGTTGDWKLCVRKGQDGKPGASIKGDRGDDGRPGRDLTHMTPDGHKYS